MLLEKHPCRRRKFLVRITLLTYFIFPCYQSFGATFSSKIDNLSFGDLDIDNEAFLEENKKNWQLIARQIISSSNQFNGIDLSNSNTSLDRSQEDGTNQPLSIQTIVEAFRQLNFGNKLPSGQVGNVPTLPQVSSADIYKGVYDFGGIETESAQPADSFVFNAPGSSYTGLPNRSSVGGFSNAGFRSIGSLGDNSASASSKVASPRGLVSLPQSQGGVRSLVGSLSAPSFNSQLAMMPQNSVSGALSRLEENSTVSNVLNALGSFGQLKVNVNFQTLPQMTMPTPLDLRDDFVKTSDLIRRDRQVISPLATEIQRQVAKKAQEQTELQRQRQNNQYRRLLDQQRKQEQIQQERLQKQQERQQKQLERYIERQKRFQENYQRQMGR